MHVQFLFANDRSGNYDAFAMTLIAMTLFAMPLGSQRPRDRVRRRMANQAAAPMRRAAP